MSNKYLLIGFVFCWGNIGVLYTLYFFEYETTFIGVVRELTIIPSYLAGFTFAIWIFIRIVRYVIGIYRKQSN